MLVEFCGIQGAGKTTLSRELCKHIPGARLSRGRSDNQRFVRFGRTHQLLNGLRVPNLFFRCLPFAKSIEELELICRLCCYERHKGTLDRAKVNILEESSYHALARLACINGAYLKFAHLIQPPDVFVWVTCNEVIAVDRVLNREYKIDINDMDRDTSISVLRQRSKIIRHIIEEHGRNVYKVDNTESAKGRIRSVAKFIMDRKLRIS